MNSWRQEVWDKAEEFRAKHLKGEFSCLPVDVFSILELELELDLIPFPSLYEKYQIDAALRADFTGVYIDQESFNLIDFGSESQLRRPRFSIAHELGHLVLHREEFEANGFRTTDEFPMWTRQLGGRKYDIEKEANEFAGRLLVPEDKLKQAFTEFEYHADQSLAADWRIDESIRKSASERIASRFGVSSQVIAARFSREEIWPESF